MKTSICIAVLVAMALLTTGCGKEFNGTYYPVPKKGDIQLFKASLTFKSGHKVNMYFSTMGIAQTMEAKYEIDGKDFKYTMAQGITQVAEITEWTGHECINFGDMSPFGFMCKNVDPTWRRIHD